MSNISITYDDTSDQIKYAGYWYLLQQDPHAYNQTYTGVNEQASFALSFFGSQVSVYGALRNENYSVSVATLSVYSIGNNVVVTYTGPMSNTPDFHVLFFNSGDLDANEHLLVMTDEEE
ncbi:hypothetical protein EW026_g6488 [Hermanssonia centrifuga]|uniref:Uncharacterized protein n=1 Tax=Hermanssonia centrifuga TaxID=98765 RepID=A0A4V3X9Q7_9APHY|nr:hypothetical protein EW026_g6488 [Hermanssonia centrifuga]